MISLHSALLLLEPPFVWMGEHIQLKNNQVMLSLWFLGAVHLVLTRALEVAVRGQGAGRTCFSSLTSLCQSKCPASPLGVKRWKSTRYI